MKIRILKLTLLAFALIAGMGTASALDGLVIANEEAPASGFSPDELKNIFTGKTKYWDGGAAIILVYVEKGADDALKDASGMSTSAFKTFWQRLAFSGRGQAPKKVADTAAAVALVASTKGAIAVIPAGSPADGVKTIEIK